MVCLYLTTYPICRGPKPIDRLSFLIKPPLSLTALIGSKFGPNYCAAHDAPSPLVSSADAPTMVTATSGTPRISTSFNLLAQLNLDSHVTHTAPTNLNSPTMWPNLNPTTTSTVHPDLGISSNQIFAPEPQNSSWT